MAAPRASQPATSWSAARTPTWKARPTAPPAPRTRPMLLNRAPRMERSPRTDPPRPPPLAPSLHVERVEERLVVLRHHLALDLEGRRELAGLLGEVLGQDGEALEPRVAGQLAVHRVDGRLDPGDDARVVVQRGADGHAVLGRPLARVLLV